MIDGEPYVLRQVKSALTAEFPGITVYDEEVETPSGFPSVTLFEATNTTNQNTLCGDNEEWYVNVTYYLNIYSIAKLGKRECKAILAKVDEVMRGMGFIRTYTQRLENQQRNICRYLAVFHGVIDRNGLVYRKG